MKIQIIAVGKLKEKFWADACDEYLKRLRPYAKVQVDTIPDRDPNKCDGEEGARKPGRQRHSGSAARAFSCDFA